jgi:outer membrane protein assembly factor BamB
MLRSPAMRRSQSFVQVSLLTASLCACAGSHGAFQPRYGDNDEGQLATLIQRLKAAPAKAVLPIAVGVGSDGTLLFGYDIENRRVLWKQPAKPKYSPIVAGGSVVTQEGDQIVARDLQTGRLRFSVSAGGGTLVGADGAGPAVLFTVTSGQGTLANSRVLLMVDSAKRWTRELDAPVGAPALSGEVALVPWNRQYLSGLRVGDGEEFARLRVRDGVISHAFVTGGQAYAGSASGIAALTEDTISGGLKKGPHYEPPKEELPGRPEFLRDAYAALPLATPESAQNRIRLLFRPQLSDPRAVALADGNLYLMFYRFVFALDQRDLTLRWVYAHEADLVGASVSDYGLVLADMRGEFLQLAARSGRLVFKQMNALPSVAVEFPRVLTGLGGGAGEGPPTESDVRQQLTAAAQDSDSRLVPMRLLAVKLLAQLDDPEATASLLGLCDDELTTIAVRKAACNLLSDRKLGTEYILAALQRHAKYLDGTTSPPVGALAKAAAAQNEKRAVPLLVAHLEDPSTPAQTLGAVVTALGDLGEASAIAPLTDFLKLYHADPVDEHVAHAVELVPAALAKLEGQAAREPLTLVMNDPLGSDIVRERAQKALASLDEQTQASEKDPEAQQLAAQQAAEQQAAEANKPPPPPQYTSADVIAKALLPVRDQIQACIKSAKPDLFQARLLIMVEDGQVLMVTVTPQQLQTCIEPLVRAQNFPRPQISKREQVSYVIKRFQ